MNYVNAMPRRLLVAILLLVAVAERFAWAAKRGWHSPAGEAANVAVSLATGRGFADPYSGPSGPTAHLMPTTPVLAGAVYWLFGPTSVTAEIALQIVSSVEMVAGYLLLFTLFGRLKMPAGARLLALAVLCLFPLFMGQESLDFRYWEGGLAVVLMALCLITLVDLDAQAQQPSIRQIAGLSLLFALTFFTSPPIGLAMGLCGLILLLTHSAWRHRLAMAIAPVACLALILAPWVVRNDLVMGKPILLRSNMGLELALANNDLQLTQPSDVAFNRTFQAIHPSSSAAAQAKLTAVGEIAYMQSMSDVTKAWIAAHPAAFARLCFRHLRQMFFPDSFQFEIGSGSFSTARARSYALIALLGLIALGLRVCRRERGYLYVGIVVAVVSVTYAPFQPMARYLYLNYGLLLFLAVGLIAFADRRYRPAGAGS